MMKEPYLSKMLQVTIGNIERNIPEMISFMDAEIDQQPWEKWAGATYISDTETEVSLMALLRDMLGQASIPSLFGRAFIDNFPDVLHDVYEMDQGLVFFLMGLPAWTPWPAVLKAHIARTRVWTAMDAHQKALDADADGNNSAAWDDLDDVSDIIKERNAVFRSTCLNCIGNLKSNSYHRAQLRNHRASRHRRKSIRELHIAFYRI